MLFIWGFRARFKTIREGLFHCPVCKSDQAFRERSARRWFTFFFIPIIPLKELGTVIECQNCEKQFDEEVLGIPTTANLSASLSVAVRAIAVDLVGTNADPVVRRNVTDAVNSFVSHDYTVDDLEADFPQYQGRNIDEFLAPLASSISEQGKEQLVSVGITLARVTNGDERAIANRVGGVLGMTPAHVAGIVSLIDSPATDS